MKKLFFIFLYISSSYAASTPRGETGRFRLLNDRILAEDSLVSNQYQNYFKLNFNLSSGLREFISDIDTAGDEPIPADEIAAITAVLLQNINTERMFKINLEVGSPLPSFTYLGFKFNPSLFLNANGGASISVFNQNATATPIAQTYIQKNIKYGFSTYIDDLVDKTQKFHLAIYKNMLSDFYIQKDADDIANSDSVAGIDDLEDEEIHWMLDLGYYKEKDRYRYLFEIRSIGLIEDKESIASTIGSTPFFNYRYEFRPPRSSESKLEFTPFIGAHMSKRYEFYEGLFLGTHMKISRIEPLNLMFKIDNQMMNFRASLDYSHFHFHYGLKTAYRNPIDDMWVSSVHDLSLNVPF